MTEDIGMGRADFLQIDSGMGIVLTRCYNVNDTHFHTVVYLKKDGNIAMAKLLMKKAIDGLATEF